MPPRELRVVAADDSGAETEMTMAEAIVMLAKRIAAEKPTVAMWIYEVAGGARHTVTFAMAALPDSQAVMRGLIDQAYAEIHPDPPEPGA